MNLIGCSAEISQTDHAFNKKNSIKFPPIPSQTKGVVLSGIVKEKNGREKRLMKNDDPKSIIIIDSSLLMRYLLNTSKLANPIVLIISKSAILIFPFCQIGIHVMHIPIKEITTAVNLSFNCSFKKMRANITTHTGIEKLMDVVRAKGNFLRA